MSSPAEEKAELQPVHRVFLGELFVFVFFFAGAMSVLVGPLGVPVATAGITIGAAVVLSAFCFLWLAFTTPVRKAEPRYAFMVLSLLPGLLICAGGLGYQRLSASAQEDSKIINLHLFNFEKRGLSLATAGSASAVFADEIAALEEELKTMGFSEQTNSGSLQRRFIRSPLQGSKEVAVLIYVDVDVDVATKTGDFYFQACVTNINLDISRRFFNSANEGWVHRLFGELQDRWRKNFDARMKAKGQ